MSGFQIGEQVRHGRFGVGTVTRFEGAMVGVDFGEHHGVKWFEPGPAKQPPPVRLPENVVSLDAYRRSRGAA